MKDATSKYQLNRIRSVLILIISISITAIIAVVVIREIVRLRSSAYDVFRYFTTVSNIIAAYASILTIPYALDGLFRQRYHVPRHITLLLFFGTISVTITGLIALLVLWPINGNDAVTGYNFWCHIVCPILVVILFIMVSGEHKLTVADCILSITPFLIYGIIYFLMVVIIEETDGGWPDFYHIASTFPALPVLILSVIIALIIAFGFRAIHNHNAKHRWRRIVNSVLKHYKPENELDLRFVLFEMGEHTVSYDGKYEMIIPVQVLRILAEYYPALTFDEMVSIYVKGALNKLENKGPDSSGP